MKIRADYLKHDELNTVLDLLMPRNRLICLVMLFTGLRVSDTVQLKKSQIEKQRFSIRETKTKKSVRVYIPERLKNEILAQSGKIYAFENPRSGGHVTRQAVWKDLNRAKRACRLRANATPHTFRKNFAVEVFKKYGLSKTQQKLNHDNPAVTLLYAMADKLRDFKND